MTLSLGQFARQQIDAQGLSVKEFAARSGLGLSHAYQILDGKRPRASSQTFEAVARGLSMTPAEMLVAMGKGTGSLDADETEMLALFRQVPLAQRLTLKQIVRSLGEMARIPPVSDPPKGRISAPDRPQKGESSRPKRPLSDCKPAFLPAYA